MSHIKSELELMTEKYYKNYPEGFRDGDKISLTALKEFLVASHLRLLERIESKIGKLPEDWPEDDLKYDADDFGEYYERDRVLTIINELKSIE